MKQSCTKLLALSISVSLCTAALSGCGASSSQTTGVTQASAETTEVEETQSKVQTEVQTEITFQLPDGSEEADIYVEPVASISDVFIRGMDASSVLVEENSGVTYYNHEGEEQDVFMTLAQSGVNYIRLRVWNDPYDENGKGYGGGNNDVATAIALGKRATKYGMKVSIDFHYSDFWHGTNENMQAVAKNIQDKYGKKVVIAEIDTNVGGTLGGEIVFTGTPKEMIEKAETITARYLRK